ncbi:MAG: sugar phosphate nucleotidyltransferase [Sinimarinibacterium sp.]|jgi:mannose-1-phosphate guanylyltransferase
MRAGVIRNKRQQAWAVALAAGDGLRLRALTTAHDGIAVPKQYCSLWGDRTLLETTLARAQSVVARERVCTVVAAQHRQWWEPLLWPMRASNTIVHPVNRGTGTGVLQAVLHILDQDPAARILLLPADHHVAEESVLAAAIRDALEHAAAHDDAVVLLGLEPEEVDTELGYIVPTPRADGAAVDGAALDVAEFVEKPSPVHACELVQRGALWNAFIVAASGLALLRLYQRRHGGTVKALRQFMGIDQIMGVDRTDDVDDGIEPEASFAALPAVDFSRDVLCGAEAGLRVMRVPACGWTDLGTPRTLAKAIGCDRPVPAAAPASPAHYAGINLSQRRLQLDGGSAVG